jgi:hypothetical protein
MSAGHACQRRQARPVSFLLIGSSHHTNPTRAAVGPGPNPTPARSIRCRETHAYTLTGLDAYPSPSHGSHLKAKDSVSPAFYCRNRVESFDLNYGEAVDWRSGRFRVGEIEGWQGF